MENIQEDRSRYSIPYVMHSSYNIKMHILFIFLILFFSALLFIPGNDFELIIAKFLSAILDLFFLYSWFYIGILKKSAILLDNQGISFKSAYGSKKVSWVDIQYAQTYEMSHNTFIGLISKNRPMKQNFLAQLFNNNYALSIPLRIFSTVNAEKLFVTISYRILNTPSDEKYQIPESPQSEEKSRNNIFAVLKSFLVSILVGLIYFLSITILNINIIVISLLGSLGVMFVYFKNSKENSISVPIRALLGLFCALPSLLVPLLSLIVINKNYIVWNGIWKTIIDCVKVMVTSPKQYLIFYVLALFLFLYGALNGLNFKFVRIIKKVFKKKQNGFYIEKSNRYISIFLIDYADFDDSQPKELIELLSGQCLIEKDKNSINAIYLPVNILCKLQISINLFQRVCIQEHDYFKLDLGGHEEPVPYGYNCLLILNEDHQIEVIRLETDK